MSEIKVNSIKGVAASTAAITVNNTDGSCTANVTSIGGGQISNRNIIHNGAMRIAQRGTSSTDNGYATVDRFKFFKSSTVDNLNFTQSQSTDAPTGFFSNSYKIDITTAESSLDVNEYLICSQRLEAQDLERIKGNQFTLSFYVKAAQTGTYSINIYQQDGNLQVTKTYTISSANTWERKTLTFPANSGTKPDFNNGFGWEIAWILAAGTGFTGNDSTSWGSYSDGGFAFGQAVNVASSTSNDWLLTGVQLEVGTQATDFEHRSFTEELQICKRYFQKMTRTDQEVFCAGYYESDVTGRHALQLPVTMRTDPSVTFSTASTFTNIHTGSLQSGTAIGTINVNPECIFTSLIVGSGGGTDGQACLLGAGGGQTATISMDAEL